MGLSCKFSHNPILWYRECSWQIGQRNNQPTMFGQFILLYHLFNYGDIVGGFFLDFPHDWDYTCSVKALDGLKFLMQKLKLNLQFTWVSYGILLFMGMAINPLTLITSYCIISPWLVWIPMSQPDMRGSIDRSRSFPLEWNGRRIIPITSIPQHDITWQQLPSGKLT